MDADTDSKRQDMRFRDLGNKFLKAYRRASMHIRRKYASLRSRISSLAIELAIDTYYSALCYAINSPAFAGNNP